jgi:hypothetical protein
MDRMLVNPQRRGLRRLVLGAALASGIAWAVLPQAVTELAATLVSPALAQADTTQPAVTGTGQPAAAAPEGNPAASHAKDPESSPDADGEAGKTDVEVKIDTHGLGILKDGKRIRIQGLEHHQDSDSWAQLAHEAPGSALFVFLIVMTVFLTPLLLIALLILYKLRKTRMHNETMLKLAEKGVVSPTAAMDALAAGPSPAASLGAMAGATAAPATPGSAPLYEQARFLRRRTAWSDLRKGIILCAVGLGLSFYSMLDDGTPNVAGLILLFLGAGYCILWFFEDRNADAHRSPPPPPAGHA